MQEQGVDYLEIFAPVARYETIRALLAASVSDEMYVHQMNVISGAPYVQGKLHDEIYMEQPTMLYKINKKTKFVNCLSYYMD